MLPLPPASDKAARLSRRAGELVRRDSALSTQHEKARKELQRANDEVAAYKKHVRLLKKREEGEHREQLLPARLLHGLLPSALLESHDFYQDLNEPRLVSASLPYNRILVLQYFACSHGS